MAKRRKDKSMSWEVKLKISEYPLREGEMHI